MVIWEGRTRNGPGRRSFLRGFCGAAFVAGGAGLAGCSAVGIGGGFSVEDEISVVDAEDKNDLGREVDGDAYFVRPTNWEDYGGSAQCTAESLAYPDRVESEDGYVVDGPGGEGLLAVDDPVPNLWTPGLHEGSYQLPIVFDDRWLEYDRVSTDSNWVQIMTVVDRYNKDVHHDGPLKESWFQDYADDDRLHLGVIDVSQWIEDEVSLLHLTFSNVEEGGNPRPYIYFNKEF